MVFDIKSNRYNILFLIVIISFIIRFLFRSHYLDDWDSVQFAIAVKDYSIPAHQPHPPGYPIYIFFGRMIDILINDTTTSLVFLSVFFGSLSIIPTYMIAEKFFGKDTAILASVMISLTPAHMIWSEVAMTDIVSLFFVGTTIYLLYLGIDSKKYLCIGSFVLGITTGIRLTDAILIFILFIVLIYRRLKGFCISSILTIVGICIWLIPIIIYTGFDKLIKAEQGHLYGNLRGASINVSISKTFGDLYNLLVNGWSHVFYIFILITLVYIVFKISKMKNMNGYFYVYNDKRFIFIISWLLIYLIYSSLSYILIHTRYLLQIHIPLSIIFSYSMIKTLELINKKSTKISFSLLILLTMILMGSQSIASAYKISTVMPAPVQAAEFIKNNYDYNDTIIVAGGSYRHLQYYLPDFTVNSRLDKVDNYISNSYKTIISEGRSLTIPISSDIYKFQREKIDPRHEYVTLYENKLKENFIIIENEGWHGHEKWGRWIKNDAILIYYSESNQTINLNMTSFYRPRTLEIYNGDEKINQINITVGKNNMIPINLKKGLNTIRLHVVEGCEAPSYYKELKNRDSRCLSIALVY